MDGPLFEKCHPSLHWKFRVFQDREHVFLGAGEEYRKAHVFPGIGNIELIFRERAAVALQLDTDQGWPSGVGHKHKIRKTALYPARLSDARFGRPELANTVVDRRPPGAAGIENEQQHMRHGNLKSVFAAPHHYTSELRCVRTLATNSIVSRSLSSRRSVTASMPAMMVV